MSGFWGSKAEMEKDEAELDFSRVKFTHLKCALMAKESPDRVISLAEKCGGGSLTEEVQDCILQFCVKIDMDKLGQPDLIYLRNIIKKVITIAESKGEVVLEDFYEQYAHYVSSFKDLDPITSFKRVLKCISFILGEGFSGNDLISRDFVIPLQCSLNILEGNTGCAIWPSSLFMSEFILSYPSIFKNRHCLELGSGVGLVGIALTKVKTSKVILTDGDLSTLANLKLNLELNHLATEDSSDSNEMHSNPNSVNTKFLPWEDVSDIDIKDLQPDIVLGADVIYDPACVPHLVRVLALLLDRKVSHSYEERLCISASECRPRDVYATNRNSQEAPVAYVATVIRNIDTFDYFLKSAEEAHLSVVDITGTSKPFNLLPYMLSYDRDSIKLYKIFFPVH